MSSYNDDERRESSPRTESYNSDTTLCNVRSICEYVKEMEEQAEDQTGLKEIAEQVLNALNGEQDGN